MYYNTVFQWMPSCNPFTVYKGRNTEAGWSNKWCRRYFFGPVIKALPFFCSYCFIFKGNILSNFNKGTWLASNTVRDIGKIELVFLIKGVSSFCDKLLDCRIHHRLNCTSNLKNVTIQLPKHYPLFQFQSTYTDKEPELEFLNNLWGLGTEKE